MDDVLQMLVFFGTVAFIVKIALDYSMKSKLIKMGMVDEKIKYLNMENFPRKAYGSLKWGIVLTFLGVGALAVELYPDDVSEGVLFGIIFLTAGVGLLVYYFVSDALSKKAKKEQEDKEEPSV